jgi:hypothetical protein
MQQCARILRDIILQNNAANGSARRGILFCKKAAMCPHVAGYYSAKFGSNVPARRGILFCKKAAIDPHVAGYYSAK